MTERPILFSGPMVRALLDGRKTQTRRIVKGLTIAADRVHPNDGGSLGARVFTDGEAVQQVRCPYGVPGDTLWGRETHAIYNTHGQHRADGLRWGPWGGLPTMISDDGTKIAYFREGFDRCDPGRWRPSIHMPRWASRLTLAITEVRVERLQDISEADAEAEGVQIPALVPILGAFWSSRDGYARLWESINGKGSWAANPWVWAVTFEVQARP